MVRFDKVKQEIMTQIAIMLFIAIFIYINLFNIVMKKAVNISLDSKILGEIDKLKKNSFGAKRSTIINEILRKYFNKKRKNKNA